MTDPFAVGQTTIFPHLDPELFRDFAGHTDLRIRWNQRQHIDWPGLLRAVDAYRLSLSMNWEQVAEEARVPGVSRFNRPNRQHKPNAETFVKLLLWMGITDFSRFLTDD